ncbi:Poly(A) polymerase cid13 [Uncinocarpus reesii 1704]|uniref:polynucleotide adenylyltransferase n=1 Tax=Uncinocarpus reesii (strain UAMH 1704) TaxID=336963 RepID=C4JN31_UNCRE|nr:Poly(A) polymerase cid13 [Uncinocarpus reesii 1704]EEP79393.1 Poly(A) polymerase cid13 [Uncinocarpus reesii 1704]
MSWPVPTEIQSQLPLRPTHTAQQSCSVPATPFHQPHGLRFSSRSRSRSPSPTRGSGSPRSAHSEFNHVLPLRPQYGGCKYETAMAHFRRRMPYSLGADLLPDEAGPLKEQLDSEAEAKLTSDMKDLYKTLLPSAESEERRIKFVRKLEGLLNMQWPGNDIKVHVFGSSGNKLCSSDSDGGMERIVCVSHAKVPIVKIWDPELQVACDMNVNNTMALENTRMMRTYVDVDDRVRPLAMIIKYWTKRRILNDAANGQPMSSFDDDLNKLVGFGDKNDSTLGELLFQFFRFYGHELDYEKNVISVREGKLISKEGKGWHLLQNNRLCVEEPFNTSRNLGNTADDTSFRGLHLELRRAFEAVAKGDLEECCEQYEYPPEEERTWERPAPQPRAVLTPMPALPSRGGRGGGRGGRHTSHYHRGGSNMGRRASNTANRNNIRSANPGFTTDIALQAQQAQTLLHDHLYQRIQILQAQEQELRIQLQNQALMTGRAPPTLIRQPYLHFPLPQAENMSPEENPRVRAGSVNQPPLTAPIRQNVFFNPSYIPVVLPSVQGTNTNPPSPSLMSAVPDARRSHRRSSVANNSPRGLRAQSQPARPLPSTVIPTFSTYTPATHQDSCPRKSPEFLHRSTVEAEVYSPNGVHIPKSSLADENVPSEYVGYYVGDSTQSHGPYRGHLASAHPGLSVHNCELPAYLHSSPEYRAYITTSEQSNGCLEHLNLPKPSSQSSQPQRLTRSQTLPDRGPLIIDGSVPPSEHRHSVTNHSSEQFMTDFSTSSSTDKVYDTPRTTPDTLSQGLHEQGSYDDLFGSSYETRHGSRGTGQINGWEPSLNHNDIGATGQMGRVETLSERLQRFQLSDPKVALDASGCTDANQYRGTQYLYPIDDQLPGLHANGSSDENSQPLFNAAKSPTMEPRMLSPTTKYCVNGFELEKPNGIAHKSRNRSRSDHSNSFQANEYREKQSDHGRKPNGIHHLHTGANGYHHSNSNGWQTTKRKSKKGARALEQNDSNLRLESVPADQFPRKGG